MPSAKKGPPTPGAPPAPADEEEDVDPAPPIPELVAIDVDEVPVARGVHATAAHAAAINPREVKRRRFMASRIDECRALRASDQRHLRASNSRAMSLEAVDSDSYLSACRVESSGCG